MEQTVLVKRVLEDGSAEVLRVRESACSGDCHKCSGCGSSQQTMVIRAENPIGAKVGDWVVIEAKSGAVLKAAVMLYIVPLVLFIAGYLLGEHLWQSGILFALAGLLFGLILVKLLDRHMTKKGSAYTITGYAKGPAA
jgi:sigma-E factor negative regulatory protein RseC